MAMKIATRINSIGGSKRRQGRLRGRLPGGFEAGLEKGYSENTNVENDEARFEAGLHAAKYMFFSMTLQ